MRIAILSASYPGFLKTLYRESPGLASQSYSEQLKARNDSLFAFADFYSAGFRAHGFAAVEFHLNNAELQYAWAREHGLEIAPPTADDPQARALSPRARLKAGAKAILGPVLRPVVRRLLPHRMPIWQCQILRAQIEDFRPDIIYNQEPWHVPGSFLRSLRAPGRWIVGQIASARPPWEDFRDYDLVVSSLPNFVSWFRARGIPSAYNRLAFEPSVAERIGPRERDIPLSFVGSVAPVHKNRVALLEYIADRFPLAMWSADIGRLPASSPLHKCNRGEAWGRPMFEILARSQITLNNHETVSGIYANNLRLYEASGMGVLQLAERKSDLHDIFVPDREIVVFDTFEDCVVKLKAMASDRQACEQIASAGQARTFRSHSYFQRTGDLGEIFKSIAGGEAKRWLSNEIRR